MASIGPIIVSCLVAPVTNIADAFTEWHRRWVEEPARFQSESEALAAPGQTYGESAAAYLLKILTEKAAPSP